MSGIHLFEYPKSVHISGRHVAIACLDKHHGLSVIEIYCHLSYVIQYFRSLLIIKSCNFVQKATTLCAPLWVILISLTNFQSLPNFLT